MPRANAAASPLRSIAVPLQSFCSMTSRRTSTRVMRSSRLLTSVCRGRPRRSIHACERYRSRPGRSCTCPGATGRSPGLLALQGRDVALQSGQVGLDLLQADRDAIVSHPVASPWPETVRPGSHSRNGSRLNGVNLSRTKCGVSSKKSPDVPYTFTGVATNGPPPASLAHQASGRARNRIISRRETAGPNLGPAPD